MTTLKRGAQANDPSYTGAITLQWTAVETGVGIICACLPLLRPLLNALIPWFAQRTARGTTRPTYNVQGYGGTAGTTFSNHNNHTWDHWGKGQNVVMNNISSRRPDSVTSSEAAITDGITRKVDFSTSVETHEDGDSEKDKQIGRVISHDHLV